MKVLVYYTSDGRGTENSPLNTDLVPIWEVIHGVR